MVDFGSVGYVFWCVFFWFLVQFVFQSDVLVGVLWQFCFIEYLLIEVIVVFVDGELWMNVYLWVVYYFLLCV